MDVDDDSNQDEADAATVRKSRESGVCFLWFSSAEQIYCCIGLRNDELPVHMTLCPFSDYKKTSLKGYMDTFRVFLKGIDAENKAALRRERIGMNQDACWRSGVSDLICC
jgi:hypothetical protein